jgi:hypothetical protein
MNRATAYKKCPRCNGSGLYFDRGICFSCGGKGSYIADRFTRAFTLDRQIEYGINDWAVEGKSGHLYVGRTAEEAKSIAKTHNYQ